MRGRLCVCVVAATLGLGGVTSAAVANDRGDAAQRLLERVQPPTPVQSGATGASNATPPDLGAGTWALTLPSNVGWDARGDNCCGYERAGDITTMQAVNTEDLIEIGLTSAFFDNPVSSYNWRAWPLGDPGWFGPTGIVFGIDTSGDLFGDYMAFFLNDGAQTVGTVTPYGQPDNILCFATPRVDGATGLLAVSFPSSCIGTPQTFRMWAFFYYETATTISEDDTEWSGEVRQIPKGYWMLGLEGRVHAFGNVKHYGDGTLFSVDMDSTTSGRGYWIVDVFGRVTNRGEASNFGNTPPLVPGERATSIARDPHRWGGFWVFSSIGRVFGFNGAPNYGDLDRVPLNGEIIDAIPTPTGEGYYMVGSDGGVFAFGDARFYGSMGGIPLNAPVQSLVPDPDGEGYWLVASDGGVFAFNAAFRGSMGNVRLNRPVTGMVPFGNGYLMVGEDGGIFNFSDQPFFGSLGATPPPLPIVSVASAL